MFYDYFCYFQLENIFKSLYANVAVWPFGSSVNGFGKMGCDLDLVLTNVLPDKMVNVISKLYFKNPFHTTAGLCNNFV